METSQSKVKLGKLSHIGIVVRDIDKAVEYYSSVLGLGPFTTEVSTISAHSYTGARRPAPG